MRLFRRREERAQLPPHTILVGPGGEALPTWAGATVDSDAAMRSSSVWACVRLLADTVSTLPVDVFRRGELDPIATPSLLVEPAAGQPLHEFLYNAMVSLLLRGNAYGIITARSGATMLPAQVELVHPDKVGVQVTEDGTVVYRILGREVDRDDVWHVKAFTAPGIVLGLSPVEYARQAIGLGLAAEKFGAQFFGDGATPSGILTTSDRVTPDQVTELAASWTDAHKGKRKPAVLSGDLKWQAVTVAPEESQFIDTMKFNVAQIARVFGVAPEMIGGEAGNSLTYANTEARALDFVRYSLSPWIVRLETALGRLLPRQHYTKFNVNALLRGTTKERYEAHKIAIEAGFLSVDEVRELEDRAPLGAAGGTGPDGGAT